MMQSAGGRAGPLWQRLTNRKSVRGAARKRAIAYVSAGLKHRQWVAPLFQCATGDADTVGCLQPGPNFLSLHGPR